MENKFKRTTVTSALPYANGPDILVIWQVYMFLLISTCAISA